MKEPKIPKNESERLKELESHQIIGLDENPDFDFITSMAAEICGVKVSLISLITEDKQWFLSHYGIDIKETLKKYSFCAHAINTPNSPFIIEDARSDERFHDNPFTAGDPHIVFYVGIPLVTANGYPLGSLCAIDDTPKKLNKLQLEKLKKLAKQTVNLIESRKKSIKLDNLNTELEKKNKLLLETQKANNIGIWELDIATGKTIWSDFVYKIHEVPMDFDHNKVKAIEFYHPDYRPIISNAITECISKDKSFIITCQIITAKDRLIWVKVTGRKVDNKLIGSFQDISDLKKNEIRYKFVLEGTNVGIWKWNIQTNETVFNERWAEMIGYTIEELAPISIETWRKFCHPDDLKESERKLQDCFEKKTEFYEIELRMTHKNGNLVWVYDRGKVIEWTKDGKPLMMYGTHQDITKRKLAEKAIKKSEKFLRDTLNGLTEHIVVLNDQGEIILTNKAYKKFGERNGVDSKTTIEGVNYIQICEDAIGDFSKGATPFANGIKDVLSGKRKYFEMEYPCHSPIEKRWFLGRVTPIQIEGKMHAVITHKNITTTKQNHTKLLQTKMLVEERETKYNILVENMETGLFLHDASTQVIFSNAAASKITGLSKDQLIGKKAIDPAWSFKRLDGSDIPLEEYPVNKCIKSKKQIKDYKLGINIPGSKNLKWVSINAVPVLDSKDKILYISITALDITERLFNEKELKKSKERAEESEFRLKLASKSALLGIWDWNIIDNQLIWDDQMYKLYGLNKSTTEDTIVDLWLNRLHSDDKESAFQELTAAVNGEKDFDTSYRVIHPDGKTVYIKANGIVLKNDLGHAERIIGVNRDITAKKLKEIELKKSKEKAEKSKQNLIKINNELKRTQKLLEQTEEVANIGAWEFDLVSNTIKISKTTYAIFELSKDTVLTPSTEIPLYREGIEKGKISDVLRERFKHVSHFDDEIQLVTFEKNIIWVRIIGLSEIKDGKCIRFYGTLQDISEQKKNELDIKRYSQIFEDSLNEVYLFDSESFKFIQVNQASIENIGFSSDELLDMTPFDINPEYSLESFKELIQPLYTKTKGIIVFESVHQRKDKSLYNVEVHLQLMKLDKKNVFVAIINDITDRIQLRKEIKAKEVAEESDRLKSAFLSNMSHEIRTPLNAILGFSSLLKKKNLSEEKKDQYLEYIESGGKNLLNLISDIVDLSKLDANQLNILNETFSLNKLINHLHEKFKVINTKSSCEIIAHKGLDEAKSSIVSDENRLSQILSNLLENAIKFTEEGKIEFGYVLKGEVLEFYVKDDGIGISEEDQAFIFERFRQVEDDYTKSKPGTGLGLAISKNLTELLGGKIWIESELNKGATFRFTIPYNQAKEIIDSNNSTEINSVLSTDKTILIAEDQAINFLFIKALLEEHDYKIIRAKNGLEAIDIFLNNNTIDLIIMDIGMPKMDGLEATEKIRETNQDIPIIAVTGYAMEEEKKKIREAGCDYYLSKPIAENKLLEILKKHL
ncbi:PAS domain S-box protein [Brumimicrobium aurantiacum]|uniref:histidine kinase n=1 Tax=Brumimicrobium aurantiacum TaxID=1737063 RepID=A0A3E1F0F8_9FLAO|nr:PAS domain S-box protein [Brumimicrobium aurantiacum]RFC55288.1 PAS domain S-box protein [Brumimicrobium aurantiacum]